ncbi:hypothetical protein BsWGS_03065 [Bradybaena similaris]
MDEPDNDEASENPSSDLDSHLNSLIENISDDECDSIICSQNVTKNEEPAIVYTFSPENKDFIPLDYLAEDKDIYHLHSNNNDTEDGKKIYDRPVVETLNSKINSHSDNAIIECATQTVGISQNQLVSQITDKTMKVTATQGLRNKRKHSCSYPDLAHDMGFYPTSSWPSDSSKLRKPKCLSYSKQAKINKACDLKLKLLKNEEYKIQSQEIFTEEIESLPELSCCNREQMAGVISESLGSKISWKIMTNATQNAYYAALSQESLFDDAEAVAHVSDEQESLFEDAEAVKYAPDEQASLKNYHQSVAPSTAVAPSFGFSCITYSQECLHSKDQTAPRVEVLDSVKLHMPLVTEKAAAPVSTLSSPVLPGQTNATFSLSPLIPQIPVQVLHEACFQVEEARHAQIPSIETTIQPELRITEATQAELPLIDEARQPELPLKVEARQPELPLIEARQPEMPLLEETRQPELPLIEEARQPEIPLIEETRQPGLPLIEEVGHPRIALAEEAKQLEIPLIEEARQPKMPLIEKTRQPELPLIEGTKQPELPLIEEAGQPELPFIKEVRQPEISLDEESKQPELPVIVKARQPELPLIEEARQPELPVIQEARQPELPLIEEARQSELPVIEEARQPELPVIEEARQPELPLIEEARQPELPLIEEARQPELPLIEEARQPELPLIEEARQPELPLIEEARQPELPLIEEARQPELPLIEEARQPELPLIEEARQSEQPLLHEANQTELPVIQDGRESEPVKDETRENGLLIRQSNESELLLMKGAEQAELLVTEDTRQTELSLLAERSHSELCQKEETRDRQLLLSPTAEGLHSLCNTQSESQDNVPCVSENRQVLFCLPHELSNEQHEKLIVTQAKEPNAHSNFLVASCRDKQSQANKTVQDSPHAVEFVQSILHQNSEVYLQKEETFLDATKIMKDNEGLSENPCESSSTLNQISATDASRECVVSACDRSAPKIRQYQYKHLVSDNIRTFDCEHQEMPRSPPVFINMDGISYSLPNDDHIVPHCEYISLEEMAPRSGLDIAAAATDGDGICKGREETVLPSIEEIHSYVSMTKPLDNTEVVANQKTTSSCTSNHQDSGTRICVRIPPVLHESEERPGGSNNDSLLLDILENQTHAHPSNEASFTSVEDTVSHEEQKVPEAESCQDLSLSEMSMYSNLPEVERGDSKCKRQIKQVFQWHSVYATAMNKSLIDQSSDCVLDGLSAIVPIVQSHRPLRVGLSRKQKVKHLHNKS